MSNETFSDDGVSTMVSDDDQISLEISVVLLASETSTATKHLKPSVLAIPALSTPRENMKDSDMMRVSTSLFPQANHIDLLPSLSTLIFDDPFYVLSSFETENLMSLGSTTKDRSLSLQSSSLDSVQTPLLPSMITETKLIISDDLQEDEEYALMTFSLETPTISIPLTSPVSSSFTQMTNYPSDVKDVSTTRPSPTSFEVQSNTYRSSCTSFGLSLYNASVNADAEKFPNDCWEILCSEEDPFTFNRPDNTKKFWFYKSNHLCFNYIYSTNQGYLQFSKEAVISPSLSFLLLNPSCAQSIGFAYLENIENNSPFLPPSCRKYMCGAGAGLLYYGNIPAVLIQPAVFDRAELIICINDINRRYRYKESSEQHNISIYSLKEYPLASPCPTTVLFRVLESGTQVLIPYRAGWCPPLLTNTWNDLFLSFYSVFQKSEGKRLYECLLDKSRRWEYHTNEYAILLQYLLKENISIPEMPKSCTDVVCNDQTEITYVDNLYGSGDQVWFSYMRKCVKNQCNLLEEMVLKCREELGDTKDKRIAKLYYLNQNSSKQHILYLSLHWSCSFGNGEGREGRLKAEALINLWLRNQEVPLACRELMCNASLQRHDYDVLIAYAVISGNDTNVLACQQEATRVSSFKERKITMFSFTISKTKTTVLFLIARNNVKRETIGFLGSLFSSSKLHLIECCNGFSTQISRYNFHGIRYYSCHTNDTQLLDSKGCLPQNQNWLLTQVKNRSNLVIFSSKMPYFYQHFKWMAAMNVTLSEKSKNFILSESSHKMHKFLNNELYVFKFESDHPGFSAFLSDLQDAKISCLTSEYLSVCYKNSLTFLNSWHNTGYLVIIKKCAISVDDKDKIVLLILTQFYDTGFTFEYLCRQETVVAMVEAPTKQVTYAVKGPPSESHRIIGSLKKLSPSWDWIQDTIIFPWNLIASGQWCVQMRNPKHILRYLGFRGCVYYYENNITLFFQVHSGSYHLSIFSLTGGKQNTSTNWLNLIKQKKIFHVTHSNIHSSKELVINTLERNPFSLELPQLYSKSQKDKVSSVQIFTQVMMRASLSNNTHCLEDLIHKKFYLYEASDTFAFGPVYSDFTDSSCFLSFPRRQIVRIQFNLKRNMTTHNKFWTTCMYNMVITFHAERPFIIDWDYLPNNCKIKESALLSVSLCITLITVIGNLVVLAVIFNTALIRDKTFLLRISLASADLLLGIFPAAQAVTDHISLMTGKIGLRHLDPHSIYASFTKLSLAQAPGFQQVRFERSGYPFITSLMLNISVNVSLLTLAFMSIETFCGITNSPLSRRQLVGGIFTTWTVSIILSVLVNKRQSGWSFSGYFDPATKLTTSMGSSAPSVSFVVFYLQISILAAAALIIIIVTVSLLVNISYRNYKTRKLLTIHSMKRANKNWKATQTFLLMVALFGASVVPLAVDVIMDLSINNPTGHFFAWWLFIAGASWNWALYSARTSKFGKEVGKLIEKRKEKQQKR